MQGIRHRLLSILRASSFRCNSIFVHIGQTYKRASTMQYNPWCCFMNACVNAPLAMRHNLCGISFDCEQLRYALVKSMCSHSSSGTCSFTNSDCGTRLARCIISHSTGSFFGLDLPSLWVTNWLQHVLKLLSFRFISGAPF